MRNAKPQTSCVALGLCYILPSTSTIQRGSLCTQQYVYPYISGVPVLSLAGMNLHDILTTPRTIVLDLDTIYLQVSRIYLHFNIYLLTIGLQVQLHVHTVVQVYIRAQWEDEIMEVSSKVSNQWFIAFVSYG